MTTTITRVSDSATTTPALVLGYSASRESRNTVHDLLDGSIAVTLIDPRPRAGRLELLYTSESAALSALNLHATSDTYHLEDTARTSLEMTYVAGALGFTLEDQTREMWVVSVEFQEIDL